MVPVSVIVPMYAVEDYLPDTLASLQNQSFSDLQIVLVDDGSPDGVGDIARDAVEADSRVRYVRQDNRGPGPGGGRNGGLDAATGEYVMFVDADDVIVPHALETMMRVVVRSRADLVTCNAARLVGGAVHHSEFHDLGHRADVENTTAMHSPWLMFDSTPWNKIFRREFFDRVVGSWPEQILYEDIAAMTRAHLRSTSTAVVSERLYYWRVRGSGQITQKTSSIEGDREQLRELRSGAAEIARWGNSTLLDWYSWKAFGYDLNWMTRKLARIAPAAGTELAADIQATMEQLSSRAFAQLPDRSRAAFGLLDTVESGISRAKFTATSWRLTPVHRGFDVTGRDPMADLMRWSFDGDEAELSVQVDAAAKGEWLLELGPTPLLLSPDTEPVARIAGHVDRTLRPDRTIVKFRLPRDMESLVGDMSLICVAVSTTCGTWRGEVGRSFRDRVAGRVGTARAKVDDCSSIMPFFINNRLRLVRLLQDTGVLSAEVNSGRLVVTLAEELVELVESVRFHSEHQNARFDFERYGTATWTLPIATLESALAGGHSLLGLAAGLLDSPSVPVPLHGQPIVAASVDGIEVFLGGYGQVFARAESSLLATAAPLLQHLRPKRNVGG